MRIVEGEVGGVLSRSALREIVDDICLDVRAGNTDALAAGIELLRCVAARIHEYPFTNFEILKCGLRILQEQGTRPPIPSNPNCEIAEAGFDYWLTYRHRKGDMGPEPVRSVSPLLTHLATTERVPHWLFLAPAPGQN